MNPPLLDTHAWIWWIHGDARLGRPVLHALDALPPNRRPAISCISLWEVATLVARGRLVLPGSLDAWFASAADARTVRILPLTPAVAVEVASLPADFHRDPADRIIVATSRVFDHPLITLDKAITSARLCRRWVPPSSPGPVRKSSRQS